MEIQVSLIVFTLFVAMGAGLFAAQGLLAVLGKGQKLQIPALIVAAVAIVIGGIGSFTHLQHWERIVNGFGHLSSGITQELISLVVIAIVMVAYFVITRKGETPKWAGILAIIVGIAVVIIMTTSYMMPARPIWASPVLYLFYLGQAVVAGGAALWIIAAVLKEEDCLPWGAKLTGIGGVIVIVALVAYALYISSVQFSAVGYSFAPTEPTKALNPAAPSFGAALFTGELAPLFWSALLIGGVVPAVLGVLQWKKSTPVAAGFAGGALVCALAGGSAFRVALYIMGISVFIFY
jgi:anaerobic dimethyl sulfoxide reductase subunit C (anchor subunit)